MITLQSVFGIKELHKLSKIHKIGNLIALTIFGVLLALQALGVANLVLFVTAGKATSLSIVLLACLFTFFAIIVAMVASLAFYHFFSFFLRTRLPKAIRLSSAMRMLNADDNSLSLKLIRFYNIAVYRTNSPLSDSPTNDIDCIYLSDFTAPWALRSSQDAALGSKNYCCNYDEILQILATNQKLWGAVSVEDNPTEHLTSNDTLKESIALVPILQTQVDALQKENAQLVTDLKCAKARYTKVQKWFEHHDKHMAVLVRLASVATSSIKSPQKITQAEVKAKYLQIGNIFGIQHAPEKYLKIFRQSMPDGFINQGGAPLKNP